MHTLTGFSQAAKNTTYIHFVIPSFKNTIYNFVKLHYLLMVPTVQAPRYYELADVDYFYEKLSQIS